MPCLKHKLLFARLEIVVIPKLLAGDDLAEVAETLRDKHFIHAQFARQPLAVELRHLRPDGVHPQAAGLAADIDRAVIHAVAEILAGVAANDHAATLHHETGEGAGIAADDDRAALLIDAGARADRSLADEIAAAQCGPKLGPGVLLDDDGTRHHVLAAGPADAPLDAHIRPVEKAAREIAAAALDIKIEAVEDADGKVMFRAGIFQYDGAVTPLHELAKLFVDLAAVEAFRVDLGALVEVDVECVGIAEADLFLSDIEEALLGAPAQPFGMHAHLVREMVLRGGGYARHTR